MKQFVSLVMAVAVAGCSVRQGIDSPEQLAEAFISAVEQKDSEQLRKLIHPACMKGLSELERKYLDFTVLESLKSEIPEDRKLTIHEVRNWSPPSGDNMPRWPVKPTHQFEISFTTGEYSSQSIINYIAKQGDYWFIVWAYPSADALKEHEKQFTSQQPNRTRLR